MYCKPLVRAILIGLGLSATVPLSAATNTHDTDAVAAQVAAMQAQIDTLQRQLNELKSSATLPDEHSAQQHETADESTSLAATDTAAEESQSPDESSAGATEDGIHLGGAVRWQFSHEGYDSDNKRRNGDIDFDIFRLDLDGSIGDVTLSAQYRWFQYMDAVHHAWVGYSFDSENDVQLGLTRIPFGNQPFNSHSYFFSSNYYLGLEDSYQMGALYIHDDERWNVQLAFFKNDALGGVDGYVSDRSNSYTYNVVGWREPGEGTFDDPLNPIGVADTGAARVAYTYRPNSSTRVEVGASAFRGRLVGPSERVGKHDAAALHLNADLGQWNLQMQAAQYAHRLDDGADRVAVGAYRFYDTIAARARSYSANLAYHLPVSWGPVTGLTFYNDHSVVSRKSGGLPDTWMNVTGMSLAAGGLFTYFDFVTARNQPFIGGSMAGDGKTEHRFNVNVGYYF